tara:strand:+ start:3911 stop:4204 length:294 start_codon:yes stop_codon:yes gene_type:complete
MKDKAIHTTREMTNTGLTIAAGAGAFYGAEALGDTNTARDLARVSRDNNFNFIEQSLGAVGFNDPRHYSTMILAAGGAVLAGYAIRKIGEIVIESRG